VATKLLLDEVSQPGQHVHRNLMLEPTLFARASTLGR
jgi:hypothetical protein